MSGRALALLAVVAVGAIVVGVFAVRPGAQQAAPSPTPAASPTPTPSPTLPASPTASPTATPTASPSPAGGRYVSAVMGYSIELTPPWRRSGCFSHVLGAGADAILTDLFVTVREYDEEAGHTGIPHSYVEIHSEPNPEGLTPRQWYERRGREFPEERVTDTTFAGEPAVHVVVGDREKYFVRHDTRMWQIHSSPGIEQRAGENTAAQRAALVATFRFLSPAELAAARAAPTPTPLPARSFEQVAQTLADGFARKDVALLMSVIDRPCMNMGVANGGGSALSTARYMDELRTRFGRGLTVAVRPTEYDQAPGLDNPTRGVESTWKEPGQQDVEVDLFVTPRGERWHWTGVLFYFGGR